MFLVTIGCVIAEPALGCTPEESVRVEAIVAKTKTWSGVYKSFLDHQSCNRESVVEVWSAYSEVVASLLADHWGDLDKLSAIASAHPEFKEFVVMHLSDETIPVDVLVKVKKHAEHECEPGMGELCKELARAAK